ncbi:chorismate-binding protein [Luteitalea sp.]
MQTRGRASFGTGGAEDAWRVDLTAPLEVREAWTPADVRGAVTWADELARAGRWAVLLLAYEAAPAFDEALRVRPASPSLPLAWAAAYAEPSVPAESRPRAEGAGHTSAAVPWAPGLDEARFGRDIARVLDHIAAGDTYQVNYTFPLRAPFVHEPWAWFEACARQAMVPFPACIDLGSTIVMSLSPELFLERTGDRLRARPMKGTIRRGRWRAEDDRLAQALVCSEKARAENVMIVDLLRNDIGRVAVTGSVQVADLCALERYPTVWQLTSRIDATLRPGLALWDLLSATFPCGSITGAPKVRTMDVIADLESSPRGLYTGAICLLRPGGNLLASVPIRTVVLDRTTGIATFSVGAGITADSTAADEWAECLAKARVVRPPAVPEDAALFETLRLEDGQYVRRDAHVARLLDSAGLFGWPAPRARVEAVLDGLAAAYIDGTWRARLQLDRTGVVDAEAVAFAREDPARVRRVALAPTPVDTRSPLLFNKTTRREVYDEARAARPDVDDVLLWNARGELTEGTIANLVVELDGVRVTPPIASGLLPGVFRADLLARGEIEERVVLVSDLARASRLWLVNSLREWMPIAWDGRV